MGNEIIIKKIDQITQLIQELKKLLSIPFDNFAENSTTVRAAERVFQLIVDIASDINTQILIERGKNTPDTYRQSFSDIGKEGIITQQLAETLAVSARLRNILVHEYDFEEDYAQFYDSAKEIMPAYEEYIQALVAYLKKIILKHAK